MTIPHPESSVQSEGLTPDIEAIKHVHEVQIEGLAKKHDLPVVQVAERCAQAIHLVFKKIEDATEIIVQHATTPTEDIPITVVEDFTDDIPSSPYPFLLFASQQIETPTLFTIDDVISEEPLDADAEENGKGRDSRKLELKPKMDEPEFTFNPDISYLPPVNYIGPTPTPNNKSAYQLTIDQTIPCPPPVATPPYKDSRTFNQLIKQTQRGPFSITDPTILTPTPENEQSVTVDPILRSLITTHEQQ